MASARRTGTNENISTYGNGTRDYTSLATWEAATDNDLVTAMQSEVLECYADSAEFTDSVDIGGATTNSSYFRIVRPASGEGHTGVPNTGVRFATTTAVRLFGLLEANLQLQDMELTAALASASVSHCAYLNAAAGVVGCLVDNPTNSVGQVRALRNEGGTGALFVNNVVIGAQFGFDMTGGTATFYNNTAVDCGTGYVTTGTGATVKNCLSSEATTADFSGSFNASSTNNASSDTSAPGSNPRVSQTFSFVDAVGDDYHLSGNDTGAKGFGIDLGADATFAFDDDIDGVEIVVWSIGFDSDPAGVAGAGGGWVIMKRRRK